MKNVLTTTGATVGFDVGKFVKGRTRLVLTDTLGQVRVVFVDSSFSGVFREHLAQRYGVSVGKLAHVRWKKPISASMLGGGLWNAISRGLLQNEDWQRSMTEACGMPMRRLLWLTFRAFSNFANSNSF